MCSILETKLAVVPRYVVAHSAPCFIVSDYVYYAQGTVDGKQPRNNGFY